MKTAILLTGNLRTWDVTKKSFLDTFSHFTPDVYVVTYFNRYGYHPHIQGILGDSEEQLLTEDDLRNAFVNVAHNIGVAPPIDSAFAANLHPHFRESNNVIGQVLRLNDAVEMMLSSGKQYDVVIKTRCDLLYHGINLSHDLSKTVIVDRSNTFPNDCIYATSQDNMINMARWMYNEIHTPTCEDSHVDPPHRLLLNAINATGATIQQQPIMQSVIRKGNKEQRY